jgi:hypothetical protein
VDVLRVAAGDRGGAVGGAGVDQDQERIGPGEALQARGEEGGLVAGDDGGRKRWGYGGTGSADTRDGGVLSAEC